MWLLGRTLPLKKQLIVLFCTDEVEDPPHAMFGCSGSPELIDLQSAFLESVFLLSPSSHLVSYT